MVRPLILHLLIGQNLKDFFLVIFNEFSLFPGVRIILILLLFVE